MDPHLLWDWKQLTGISGFVFHHCETPEVPLEYCLSYGNRLEHLY